MFRTASRFIASILFSAVLMMGCSTKLAVSDFNAERTTASERAKFIEVTTSEKIEAAIESETTHLANLTDSNRDDIFPYSDELQKDLGGAFWNAAILNFVPGDGSSKNVDLAIQRGFDHYEHHSSYYRHILMRSAHALYGRHPEMISGKIAANIQHADTPKAFAIGVSFLMRYEIDGHDVPAYLELMRDIYPDWETTPQLLALEKDYEYWSGQTPPQPPLLDMLKHPFGDDYPVIFSLQRRDRRYPGIAIVRHPDGSFARTDDGSLFQISQLAMARTDMPGTVTFGNSPRGVYSIKSYGTAGNQFIGPVPYLWSRVPVEADVDDYFFGEISGEWNEDLYRSILPDSWENYDPAFEAFWAGQAGRSEMIIHGTTINTDFYSGETYWPQTPSAGCLCAYEKWDPETGDLIYSDQLALVNAFLSTGNENGFLVVIELDDQKKPVKIDEVIDLILAAESTKK